MNLYLSIAFTLLAAVAGMYLLAKAKNENLGKLFTLVAYLVIIIAGFSLLCQLGRGVCSMMYCKGGYSSSENCMPGMMMHKKIIMHGTSGECRMHSGGEEMDECCPGERCCGGMSGCDMNMRGHGKCCDEMKEGGEGDEGCGHGMKEGRMVEKDTIIKK